MLTEIKYISVASKLRVDLVMLSRPTSDLCNSMFCNFLG